MSSLNPFGYMFASRFLAEDNPSFIAYEKEKEMFNYYCLQNNLDGAKVSPHYASVNFKISKITMKKEWMEETITYETHYISVAYFSVWLGLSVEDYIDIERVAVGCMPFKKTNIHSFYNPIYLYPASNETYVIQVVDICYYGAFDLVSVPLRGPLDYMAHPRDEVGMRMVEEYDPMQWY